MTARANTSPKTTDGSPARAIETPVTVQRSPARARGVPKSKALTPARASLSPNPTAATPARGEFADFRDMGRVLDDLERVRIINSNRIAAEEREFGSASLPLLEIHEGLCKIENLAVAELEAAWKRHPLAPWAKTIPGAGPKLMARLISEIGDPSDRPNPAKLWAYCGHGDPARKKRKGMTQDEAFALGNPWAKKRVWLLAAQFMKTRQSPYRIVYEDARAVANEEWTLGHQHAHALRLTGKRFLLDLWVEAWRLRTLETGEKPARRGGRRGKESQRRHQANRTKRQVA